MRISNALSSRKPEPRHRGAARSHRARLARIIAAIGLVLLVACDSPEPEPEPRFSEPEYDGLTREEIESRAEAMTPEEAERLGIVDTTIRIEAPMNPDSVLPFPVDTPAPPR